MGKGSNTQKEWEQYSAHNIRKLQQLPMSELYALGEVLKGIVTEYQRDKDSGNMVEEEKEFANLMLSVSRKRLDILTMAKFKKIEGMFDNPKFK